MISGDLWITILKLASVPFLVLLNGFFVAAEFALVTWPDEAARAASPNIGSSTTSADLRQPQPARARPDHSQMEHAV